MDIKITGPSPTPAEPEKFDQSLASQFSDGIEAMRGQIQDCRMQPHLIDDAEFLRNFQTSVQNLYTLTQKTKDLDA